MEVIKLKYALWNATELSVFLVESTSITWPRNTVYHGVWWRLSSSYAYKEMSTISSVC